MIRNDYDQTCLLISRFVMRRYSTSFSLGTRMFPVETRHAITAIYGFMRLADEVVDAFHGCDQGAIFAALKTETDAALKNGVSTNPILHAFQLVVRHYGIDRRYIEAFLVSMEMDLTRTRYNREQFEQYVYGSAEVVGLMCLKVFCHTCPELFPELIEPARKLGAAFQKVNFLRDLKSDLEDRGRIYLPGIQSREGITAQVKQQFEAEIAADFVNARQGIRRMPRPAQLAVYSTYLYYQSLFLKLQAQDIAALISCRIRVNNLLKFALLIRAWFDVQFSRI